MMLFPKLTLLSTALFLMFSSHAKALGIDKITADQRLVLTTSGLSAGSCQDEYLCGDPDFGLEINIVVWDPFFLFPSVEPIKIFEIASVETGKSEHIEQTFLIEGEKILKAVQEATADMTARAKEKNIEPNYTVELVFDLIEIDLLHYLGRVFRSMGKKAIISVAEKPMFLKLHDPKTNASLDFNVRFQNLKHDGI